MANPIAKAMAEAEFSAVHLEMRDNYTPNDPQLQRYREGLRYGPDDRPEWFQGWTAFAGEAIDRGVLMRRARIVSEPVTEYIRYEHHVTFLNVAIGEQVRWLPRRLAADIALPGTDLWMFDDSKIMFTFFSGDGDVVDREWTTEPSVVQLVKNAFETVWDRATPHESYVLK
nr:hypothetical protein KPHV_11130 [Kitasatospora purpeofusca]